MFTSTHVNEKESSRWTIHEAFIPFVCVNRAEQSQLSTPDLKVSEIRTFCWGHSSSLETHWKQPGHQWRNFSFSEKWAPFILSLYPIITNITIRSNIRWLARISYLWRYVWWCPGSSFSPLGLCDSSNCQAKISDFDVAVIIQEDIFRLDVSVDDLPRMQKLQTADHFRYEVSDGEIDILISITNHCRPIKSKDKMTSPYST